MEENKNLNVNEQAHVAKNNEKKGRGLFYFVIAIAIIIISVVGATYAYFTASARTNVENSVTAGSTSISLGIETDRSGMNSNLIPVSDTIAKYAYAMQPTITYSETECATYKMSPEGQPTEECETYKKNPNSTCVDDSGTEVCSAYSYTIINNNSSNQKVTMYLGTTKNTFANLWFAVYTDTAVLDEEGNPTYGEDGQAITQRTRVSEPMPVGGIGEEVRIAPIVVDGDEVQSTYFANLAIPTLTVSVPRRTYTIILWIHELKGNNDERNVYDESKAGTTDADDQTAIDGDKAFEGYVSIKSGDGNGVTGLISGVGSWDDTPVAGGMTTPTLPEDTSGTDEPEDTTEVQDPENTSETETP